MPTDFDGEAFGSEPLADDVVVAKMELLLEPGDRAAASKSWNFAWVLRAASSTSTSPCVAFVDDIAIVCAVVRVS